MGISGFSCLSRIWNSQARENWNGRHGELDIRRLGPLQTTEFLMFGRLFWTGCVSGPACGKAMGAYWYLLRNYSP